MPVGYAVGYRRPPCRPMDTTVCNMREGAAAGGNYMMKMPPVVVPV